MKADYGSRFPTVKLLDEHGQPTGMVGQVFGRLVDENGAETCQLAVMLTAGGQGCKHWPESQLRQIGDKQ